MIIKAGLQLILLLLLLMLLISLLCFVIIIVIFIIIIIIIMCSYMWMGVCNRVLSQLTPSIRITAWYGDNIDTDLFYYCF